ncbi:hypothetical protein XSR1_120030 [Xenorhabdus szentirmaii DSM 16338]|uniref:Uncharacterized protein n=1 Tax=Xenorhabdus szentirmaii DSM 16338 TaxID=1427518 RepID=W1IS86_9GAMM|nr:hypothetical protein XSR1_120030 [Xenorhabdus szentirmaii DSM 16338]
MTIRLAVNMHIKLIKFILIINVHGLLRDPIRFKFANSSDSTCAPFEYPFAILITYSPLMPSNSPNQVRL